MSRNNPQQQDLQLLVETINNKSAAEANGVKFIYMDDNTIYRFENNRMKKVSASLLKKASKLAAQDIQQISVNKSEEDNSEQEQTNIPPKRSQRSKKVIQQVDEEYSEDEPEPVSKPKSRTSKRIPKVPTTDIPQVDLNEYWNVKNKNEFMQSELERLNNKVSKLRHYKNIVNRLTGAEYDADIIPNNIPATNPQQPLQQPLQNNYDNYFNNTPQHSRTVNDSLFL